MINDATKSTECDDTSAYRSDKILIFKTHRPNIYNSELDTFHKNCNVSIHQKGNGNHQLLAITAFFQKNRIAQKKFERRLIS